MEWSKGARLSVLYKAGLIASIAVGLVLVLWSREPESHVFTSRQFMENTDYRHALEEELAHAINEFNLIKTAQVHIIIPSASADVHDVQEPNVIVAVQVDPSSKLEKQTVSAIVNLVASSIPNLATSHISVTDQIMGSGTRKN